MTKSVLTGALALVLSIICLAVSSLIPGKYVRAGSNCRPIVDVNCISGPHPCTVAIAGVVYTVYEDAACTIALTDIDTNPTPTIFE